MLYIIFIIIVAVDQITKYYAVEKLMGQDSFTIIGEFLQFNYTENFGAAFGILQNKQYFFIIITVVIVIGIIIFMKFNKNILSKMMKISLVMILAGAIGNFIDRIRLGYVVDFIDVKFGNFYDYPIFNIADSSIVVATFIIMYLILTNKFEINRNE